MLIKNCFFLLILCVFLKFNPFLCEIPLQLEDSPKEEIQKEECEELKNTGKKPKKDGSVSGIVKAAIVGGGTVIAVGGGLAWAFWPQKNSGNGGANPGSANQANIASQQQRWENYLVNNNLKELIDPNKVQNWPGAATPEQQANQIKFYNEDKPGYAFTNFYPKTSGVFEHLLIDGIEWASTEAYFHYQKFAHLGAANPINPSMSASDALKTARSNNIQILPGWENNGYRIAVMHWALYNKFNQNPALKGMLLHTWPHLLTEYNDSTDPHKQNEDFWAYAANRIQQGVNNPGGKNMLGILLMRIRGILYDQDHPQK